MSLENRPNGPSRVVLDHVFTALAHPFRRRILIALIDHNPRDQEEFETVEFESAGDGPIEIELHHNHLPALDDAGFIDWEPGSGEVRRGEHFGEIRPLMELIDGHREELPYDWP